MEVRGRHGPRVNIPVQRQGRWGGDRKTPRQTERWGRVKQKVTNER
jgi:hypothetical protein